ncbi:hypothetical protein ABN197_16995 [Providencia alcalifaciens]|uniref:hypothetical protein n=1 Tax=Providencia alcalifaciens TaxID=126385 RepID=UPI0032DB74DD
MGLFNSEPKIYRNFDSRVFIGNSVSNVKSILNLGLVKASVTVQSGKFTNEDEVLKNELINISIENGGNVIINFRM